MACSGTLSWSTVVSRIEPQTNERENHQKPPGMYPVLSSIAQRKDEARKRSKKKLLTVARGVGDEAGAVAVVDAAVVVQELAGVAFGAVLAMLAGAMLADLAMRDGGVVLVRALAAVVDRRVDDAPGRLANEGVGAAALELPDARGGELHRA